jgi:hypothetical protein
MGFIKQSKVSGVGAQARRAHEEGRRFFVAQLHPGSWSTGLASGSAGDLAEMIEAIEDEGWTLAYAPAFVARDDGKKMTAYCTFQSARVAVDVQQEPSLING